jgi:hypothetical protein
MPKPRSSAPDTDHAKSEAQAIDDIASELNHLSLSRMEPDAFLEHRNDLVVRLRRLAKRLGAPKTRTVEALTTYRAPGETKRTPGRDKARVIIVRRVG